MKVNFDRNFKGIDGKCLKDHVGDVVSAYLFNATSAGGRALTREEKLAAYTVSCRIMRSPSSVELSAEEAALVKGICLDGLTAGAYGQLDGIIEGTE